MSNNTSRNNQYEILDRILQGDLPPVAERDNPHEADFADYILYQEGKAPYERRFDKFIPAKR